MHEGLKHDSQLPSLLSVHPDLRPLTSIVLHMEDKAAPLGRTEAKFTVGVCHLNGKFPALGKYSNAVSPVTELTITRKRHNDSHSNLYFPFRKLMQV